MGARLAFDARVAPTLKCRREEMEMPNRLVVNSTKADVTIALDTAPAEGQKVLDIADIDLPTWLATAGVAVLDPGADYQTRRAIARTLKYERVQ